MSDKLYDLCIKLLIADKLSAKKLCTYGRKGRSLKTEYKLIDYEIKWVCNKKQNTEKNDLLDASETVNDSVRISGVDDCNSKFRINDVKTVESLNLPIQSFYWLLEHIERSSEMLTDCSIPWSKPEDFAVDEQ